jgi:hypothetical protein
MSATLIVGNTEASASTQAEAPAAVGGGHAVFRCRFCSGALSIPFCNLGSQPLANSFAKRENADQPDPAFPLEARVCERCFLVQLAYVADARHIFSEYAYFSSYSSGWMAHAAAFAQHSQRRFELGRQSWVVEVASNDGYLLKNFVAARIPCLGIEPAANVAAAALAGQVRGARWDDPAFGIKWPRPPTVVAGHDMQWAAYRWVEAAAGASA